MNIKQSKINPSIGAFQVQLSGTMSFYMVYINLAMMGTMFWHTTAYPILSPFIPWINFIYFAALMVAIILAMMYLDYRFMLGSRTAFLSKQAYKHQNPIVKDFNKMLKTQESQDKRLENIEKILQELLVKGVTK